MWDPPKRNFDGIEHEKLRKEVDGKFNDLHDELSDCFYNKKPYKTYGILTKEQFDKLHGLIFHKRDEEFYKDDTEKVKKAKEKIADLKKEGYELKS